MQINSYNPDVLTCLANLSNDEVFTPPTVVNQMLDMLPAELFCSSTTKFLDPVSKSGVFLREIAKRLMDGLKKEFPDERERANHIFTKQLFGISITELTSLISRRTLYCSKSANGNYSLCTEFNDEQGNIRFKNIEHTFVNGKCKWCGASEDVFGKKVRGDLESHAYEFIHTDKPEKLFPKNMKFDVIIGNPPYQIEDGGAQKSASPIYQIFIEQAKKLNPRFLTMIVPARWYNGGKGLDEFRDKMLHDNRIKVIHDFPDTSECFPGVNIRGGVCYFLWEKDYKGDVIVVNHKKDEESVMKRPLLEKGAEIFIRYNKAIDILRKVTNLSEPVFMNLVSSRKPFGLATNFYGFTEEKISKDAVYIYRFGKNGYIKKNMIEKNIEWVDECKVIVPYASPGDDSYPHLILSQPIVAGKGTCCTETYLVVGPFDTMEICENVKTYMKTRFCRFMILLSKSAQHVTSKVYRFVPLQDFSHPWTDEMLYKKYGLTEEEIAFIESMIRPME